MKNKVKQIPPISEEEINKKYRNKKKSKSKTKKGTFIAKHIKNVLGH